MINLPIETITYGLTMKYKMEAEKIMKNISELKGLQEIAEAYHKLGDLTAELDENLNLVAKEYND